ncbi:MAG TPA: cell division protein FtsQ/DivIB [Acidiphilium sp.]
MPRVKSRKPKIQDRPSPRTLLLRRLRKSGRPALLVGAIVVVLVVVPLGVRGVAEVLRPLGSVTAHGLADLGFRVEHVDVVGATTTPAHVIETALDLPRGTPILGFSPAVAAARVEALGPVKSAVVERLLPDTVRVTITERRAVAIWQKPDNSFALIGANGAVLDDHDAAAARARNPGLPLLVGAGVPAHAADLLALLRQFPEIGKHVAAAERIDNLRWNLLLKDRTVIKLPDRHVAAAMATLMTAEARIRLLERPVRTIDLRLADRLVVRPYPSASPSKPAEHKS